MKLLLCTSCRDIIRLVKHEIRSCSCGECRGSYTDNINAWYEGSTAMPLGIADSSLVEAFLNQPDEDNGSGNIFTAFVIPKKCKTFVKKSPKK